MAGQVTIMLRLSLEEARAYWTIADEILGLGEPYKRAIEREGEQTINAAERAHDRLREEIEPFEDEPG